MTPIAIPHRESRVMFRDESHRSTTTRDSHGLDHSVSPFPWLRVKKFFVIEVRSAGFGDTPITLGESVKLFVSETLDVDQLISGATRGKDELIELEMERLRFAVLCILDQENHQKRDDCRRGVDDELPVVGKPVKRPQASPEDHRAERETKPPSTSGETRRQGGHPAEVVAPRRRCQVRSHVRLGMRKMLSCWSGHGIGLTGQIRWLSELLTQLSCR